MINLDDRFTHWVNSLAGQGSAIDSILIAVSAWAVPVLVAAVALQWWSGEDRPANRHTLVAVGLSFSLGLGINQIILLFVHRLRPYDTGVSRLLIERSHDFSFPSDHATATVAIAAGRVRNARDAERKWIRHAWQVSPLHGVLNHTTPAHFRGCG